MKQIITKLFSRMALIAGLAMAFAESALATDVTDVINNAATSSQLGNTATSSWGNDFDITGTSGAKYYIHSMGTKNTTNALQWNANGYLYMKTAPSGYKLKSVTITTTANKNIGVYAQNNAYSAAPTGSALSTLAATSSGATYTFTSDYTYLALKGTASSTSITSISIVWEEVSGSAAETTTTINSTGITNTDVYVSTVAGSLSASVTSGGNPVDGASVTWSGNNNAVATINAATGAVTLVAAGTVKFTASYNGESGVYLASSAEHTMTVTSSAPYVQPTEIEITPNYTFWGKDAQFSGSDFDELSGSKDNVTLDWERGSGSTYANQNAMRFYKDNELTFTAPDGYEIKSIELDVSGTYSDLEFSPDGWDGTNKIWSGSSETVTMSRPSNASSYATINLFTITIGEPSVDPVISASDVNIAYNATEGNITFTITNPVDGGSVSASTEADWITPGSAVSASPISFTCSANNETTARSATVTLTYTYNTNQTVTKTVTVTQAASPVIYSTIPALFAAATGTETNVLVTFDSWVVSGVSTNGKNVYVTDNAGNGFIIYSSSDVSSTYHAGDILSGDAVSCTLKLYNGAAEVLNLDATNLTIKDGGTVSVLTSIAMASLAGVNTGALVSYSNLTCSVSSGKYYLSDGTTTLQMYNQLYAFEALEDGKKYNITGVYVQYSSTKEILPRSADDIEDYVSPDPEITVSPATINPTAAETDGSFSISYANLVISGTDDFAIQFYDSVNQEIDCPNWIVAVIEEDGGDYSVAYTIGANEGEARSAYFKVWALGGDIVYSNLVTINQAAPVIDYATLPFEFNDGKDAITSVNGLSQSGLGSDYGTANTKLKFDTAGDYLKLKINSAVPGNYTLAFQTQNNGFSGGTFKVCVSADDLTYTDLKVYNSIQNGIQKFDNIPSDVRYIMWEYTSKSSGNVGLGNIKLSQPEETTEKTVTASLNDGKYWATFYCSGAAYSLPSGAKAYTLTTAKQLYLLENGSVVPANTAVIIISDTAELTLTKTDDVVIEISGTDNILKGSSYGMDLTRISGTPYVLGIKTNVLSFYKFAGTTVPANKAYYIVNE